MDLDARVCDRARLARDARFDGLFFIAVRSTGIYCRPICPSPTARKSNVVYYRSAAEAVAAGFRPCRRCRPETAPGTPAWRGTSSTVSRALRLIEEGVLQDENLPDLSRRLGVSARQLHRLFSIHLGASPIAVAKTWRLNFAKRLISDSALPMSRVALASGFRTVRRFNDAIRSVYGRTPSELRRRSPALHAGRDEYVFRLPYRPPYDWSSLLAFLEARRIPGVEEIVSDCYRRTFSQGGRHGVLEIRHDARARSLQARVRFAEPAGLLAVVTRIRGMFDLDADDAAVARHFRCDPLLGSAARRFPGLRVPGTWDPFETAVRAILGEDFTGAASGAAELVRRFGSRLGVPDDGRLAIVFPDAEILAKTSLDGLAIGRARAIRALAEATAGGLFATTPEPEDESLARLAGLPGVGDSTAQFVALRAFRHPDAFPAGDPALRAAASPAGARTAAELTRLAERWRPWRAYAAITLWRAAESTHLLDVRAALPTRVMRAG